MADVFFERQYRTPFSEGYVLLEGENKIGRVELHFTQTMVYCTLIVERELEEDELLDLIQQVDDDLVLSAGVAREDFVVSVYQGRDLGTFEDDYFGETDENGHTEREWPPRPRG